MRQANFVWLNKFYLPLYNEDDKYVECKKY